MRKKAALLATAALLVVVGALDAHDLFLKLHTYVLRPDAPASVALLNGTFEKSENAIARGRMADVSVVGPEGGRVVHPDTSRWRDSAGTAVLDFRTGRAGTYLLGVSTRPRTFTLSGEDFDGYLRHDGVLDVLEARRAAGELGTEATETYSKHVKAVVQVGTRRTGAFRERLGYPVELVPLQNPYELAVGDTLELLFLKEGAPVAGQIVYANGGRGRSRPPDGGESELEPLRLRTDGKGVAAVPLERPGKWYARLIHMVTVEEDPEVDYESLWTTLTWEVTAPPAEAG